MNQTKHKPNQSKELDHRQSAQLIARLPQFELSYETISHKKVSSIYNVCLAIPQSKKYYAYFSFQRDQDVCYLMELTREKKIGTITLAQTLFHPSLSLGTLLYGSLVESGSQSSDSIHSKKYQFVVEDIFYYKGISLRNTTFSHKLGFIYEFMQKTIVQKFDETEPDTIFNIIFVLPIMWTVAQAVDCTTPPALVQDDPSSEFDAELIPPTIAPKITYLIHHLQYRSLLTICPFLNVFSNKKPNLLKDVVLTQPSLNFFVDTTKKYIADLNRPQYSQKTIFRVMADLQYDIYHLYAYGKNCEVIYYDYAYIPNYRVSVFMNGLFRNIKENRNLDFIEESDDEADFQDMNHDKYVDLTKILFIECSFHKKFKRWTPLRLVDKHQAKVVHISKLVKNYIY